VGDRSVDHNLGGTPAVRIDSAVLLFTRLSDPGSITHTLNPRNDAPERPNSTVMGQEWPQVGSPEGAWRPGQGLGLFQPVSPFQRAA